MRMLSCFSVAVLIDTLAQAELNAAAQGRSLREEALMQEIAVLRANVEDLRVSSVVTRLPEHSMDEASSSTEILAKLHEMELVSVYRLQCDRLTLYLNALLSDTLHATAYSLERAIA